MTITREQFDGLNFRKINKYQQELEEFDGPIPLSLYSYIHIGNRIDYLEKIGNQYEYANMEEYRKNPNIENDIKDILQFINNNVEFEEIIKIKE